MNLDQMLGRPATCEDQPPGTYRYRHGKGCPWQPLRIMFDDGRWFVLLRGEVVGFAADPTDIPLVKWRGPFHEISEEDYADLMAEYRKARPGSPLLTPEQPINLRDSPALHRKEDDG